MSNEDQFRSRQKNRFSLKRKEPTKNVYSRYLIICEGEKTEPFDVRAVIDEYRLGNNVDVISPECTCPKQLVGHAKKILKEDKLKYDKIYCVFDKDTHTHYDEALGMVKGSKKIIAANSIPCFEYWLILHFEKTTRSFYGSATESPGQVAATYLKRHISNYNKGLKGIYQVTKNHINQAIKRANHINNDSKNAGTDDPSTHVVELVESLKRLCVKMRET